MATRRSFTHLVVAACACAVAFAANEYKPLDKTRTLHEVFATSAYSFKVADNLSFCKKATITIPLSASSKDYSSAINDALLRLHNAGGGTVLLQKGVYRHKTQIVLPSYTCLRGAGMDKTTLMVANNSPPYEKSGSIRSVNSERVSVLDLTQDGNKGNQPDSSSSDTYGRYGYFHELTNFALLRRVRVQNNHGYGFDPHGDKVDWSFYLIIEDCESLNNGYDGVTLDQSYYSSVLNTKSYGNSRHGFNVVTGFKVALLKGNAAAKNGFDTGAGCGYMVQNNQQFGTSDIRLINDYSNDNYKAGFCLNDVYNILIKNSVVDVPKGSIGLCYQLTASKSTLLDGNTCNTAPSRKFKLALEPEYQEKNDKTIIVLWKDLQKPDATCVNGLSNTKVCCPKQCNKCGGIGCGLLLYDQVCCQSTIRANYSSCNEKGAPCWITQDLPLPAPVPIPIPVAALAPVRALSSSSQN